MVWITLIFDRQHGSELLLDVEGHGVYSLEGKGVRARNLLQLILWLYGAPPRGAGVAWLRKRNSEMKHVPWSQLRPYLE